jgi:hypothetical protein
MAGKLGGNMKKELFYKSICSSNTVQISPATGTLEALKERIRELTCNDRMVAVDKEELQTLKEIAKRYEGCEECSAEELSLLRRIAAGATSVIEGYSHIMRHHTSQKYGVVYDYRINNIITEYPTLSEAFAALDAAEEAATPVLVKNTVCNICGGHWVNEAHHDNLNLKPSPIELTEKDVKVLQGEYKALCDKVAELDSARESLCLKHVQKW